MASNSDEIVQQGQDDFQNLLAYGTGPDARERTASTVELTLFRRLLALGAALLRLFLVTRAAGRPAEPVMAPDGAHLIYHDQRPTPDDSVCGNVCFGRQYFTAPGQAGLCPLDAELSLPARCSSDLLREWATYGATDESYRESQTVLARILGLSLSLQAIERAVVEAAGDVTPFDEQPAERAAPPPAATILVVQADGTGGRWCSRLPLGHPCAEPRGRSARRRRKLWSRVSRRSAPTSAPPRTWLPPCYGSLTARSRQPAHSPSAKHCGPPGRGRRPP